MLKKLLVGAFLIAGLLVPATSYAETVCTQGYGDTVTCKEEEDVLGVTHDVIDTGIADNPAMLASLVLGSSYALFVLGKKLEKLAA